MYIRRAEDSVIGAFITDDQPHKPVLLVEGARQVGKTRLVTNALDCCDRDSVRVNLERDALFRSEIDQCREFREFEELLEDRYGFTGASGRILFIDEAQESRKLGGFVRFMNEEWERATVILTGSTLRRLFGETTRCPVGRVQRLILRPLSFSEFLVAQDKPRLAEVVRRCDPARISPGRHERLLELYDEFLETGGAARTMRNSGRSCVCNPFRVRWFGARSGTQGGVPYPGLECVTPLGWKTSTAPPRRRQPSQRRESAAPPCYRAVSEHVPTPKRSYSASAAFRGGRADTQALSG